MSKIILSENFIKNIEQKMLETDEAIVELYENAVNSPSAVEGEDTPRLTAESLRGRNATGVPNISGVGTNSVRAGKGSVGGEQPSFGNSYNHVVRFGDITQTHKIKTALRMISLFTLLKSLYGEIIEELSKEMSLKNRMSFTENQLNKDIDLIKNILKVSGYYFAKINTSINKND